MINQLETPNLPPESRREESRPSSVAEITSEQREYIEIFLASHKGFLELVRKEEGDEMADECRRIIIELIEAEKPVNYFFVRITANFRLTYESHLQLKAMDSQPFDARTDRQVEKDEKLWREQRWF